jgi:hypothetical protein
MLASVRSHRNELLAFQIQQSDEFFNRPDVARWPRLHCGRNVPHHLPRVLVISQAHKLCVLQMIRVSPLQKLNLGALGLASPRRSPSSSRPATRFHGFDPIAI